MREDIDILLSRYFSGEASALEQELLDKWIAESKENEAYFDEMTTIFQYSSGVNDTWEPDVESALTAFNIFTEKEAVKKPLFSSIIPYLSAAASFVLLIGVAFFFARDRKEYVQLSTENSIIQESIFDGVDVILSEETVLDYNPSNKKDVMLTKGKAAFNVHTKGDDKLRVHVGDAMVEDIGTKFTVIAEDPEKSITVEVSEGEILFYTKKNAGIRVKKSEKGIYYPQDNYFELVSAVEHIKAIEFKSTPLSEVMAILSAQYHVKITPASKSLNKLQISVSFDPNETIDNILHIIAETLSIRVTKKSSEDYVLSYY